VHAQVAYQSDFEDRWHMVHPRNTSPAGIRNAGVALFNNRGSAQENLPSLTPADWKDIAALQKWAIKKYKIQGGGIAMRFGDTSHTGATVAHLHMHLIVPKLSGAGVPGAGDVPFDKRGAPRCFIVRE